MPFISLNQFSGVWAHNLLQDSEESDDKHIVTFKYLYCYIGYSTSDNPLITNPIMELSRAQKGMADLRHHCIMTM